MGEIDVLCTLKDYSESVMPQITVQSCTNNEFVKLNVSGKKYTIKGQDLIKAVTNCMNA